MFGLEPDNVQPTDTPGRDYVYPDNFSVWVMENDTAINPDDWYDKFVYFPIEFSKQQFNQNDASSLTIDRVEGKYIVYNDLISRKLILVGKSNYMYLIQLNDSSVIDNQILSTFKFTK